MRIGAFLVILAAATTACHEQKLNPALDCTRLATQLEAGCAEQAVPVAVFADLIRHCHIFHGELENRAEIRACTQRTDCANRARCIGDLCSTGCRRAARPLLAKGCKQIDDDTWDCHGGQLTRDLRWVNLSRLELREVNLAEVDLRGSTLIESQLEGADLSRARLEGALLAGANLSRATAEGANFEAAVLTGVNLSGARLSNAALHTDLSGANLRGAELRQVRFGASLRGVDLRDADLTGAQLPFGVDLSGARFGNTVCPDGTRSQNHNETCAGHVAVTE